MFITIAFVLGAAAGYFGRDQIESVIDLFRGDE